MQRCESVWVCACMYACVCVRAHKYVRMCICASLTWPDCFFLLCRVRGNKFLTQHKRKKAVWPCTCETIFVHVCEDV